MIVPLSKHTKYLHPRHYQTALDDSAVGEDISYVYSTGLLVLKIKEAIETGEIVICDTSNFLDHKLIDEKVGK